LIRFFIIFFLILTNTSFAEIKKINIIGNARVNTSTIESLIDKKANKLDTIYINNLTKKIYDTDFFADVKISFNQDVLTITVTENPIVNFFYINGIKDADLDQINKILLIKENSIFSPAKLKQDIENAKDYFKELGYYLVNINPEIYKIDNNQVNLIINIDKNEISKIKNIFFIGNRYFSSSQLLSVISSSEDGWWKIFSSSGLSEKRIEYDKELLKDFYKSKGFFDVQIETAFANIDSNKNFSVTFSINAGEKYNFGKLEVKTSNNILKEDDFNEIRNFSNKFINNQIYSSEIITKLNNQILKFIDSKKYNNTDIKIEEVKSTDKIINVIVSIDQGKNLFLNKVNISGNAITNEKTIRDNLSISEGDNFNISKIKKSLDQIKSKQYFRSVDYNIQDSDKKNFKDLNIIVKEQATGSISGGIGYGTNGGMLEAAINEKNFLGQGINLNLTTRFATEKISGDFTVLNPNFNNSEKELFYSLYSETDDFKNSGYQNKKIGNKISTKYEIFEDIYFKPNALLQYDKLEASGIATALLRTRSGNYKTSSLGYNFSFDARDSKFNPTSGGVLYFEQNFATLISDVPTVQTNLGATIYKELINQDFIGSIKARLDTAIAFDNKNIKLSDRLHGSTSVIKGFENRGIGPIDGGDHIGGNYLSSLSLRSTFPNPIPENLRANTIVFFDVANVWGVDYSDTISDSNKFRTSAGVSLDIMSPFGPISFSYAIPITSTSTDKKQNFLFNIGSSF
jgi:outer membrane protein insertion porin family